MDKEWEIDLNGKTWWDRFAGKVQKRIRDGEREDVNYYEDEEVKQSIVHTREDVVMLVCHLSSVNRQLQNITILLSVVVFLLVSVAGGLTYFVVRTTI